VIVEVGLWLALIAAAAAMAGPLPEEIAWRWQTYRRKK
jgi:hypothetical protein